MLEQDTIFRRSEARLTRQNRLPAQQILENRAFKVIPIPVNSLRN